MGKRPITEVEAKIFEAIMNRIARAMDGYRWQYEGIVKKVYSDDFKRQKCESGDFEYELLAQYGNGDMGYHGEILFPLAEKYLKISWWE